MVRESGTSASAPVFSAMVTQWNDIRLTYGLPPMGFVAPWLYDAWENNPEAFNDIVTGNNVSISILSMCLMLRAHNAGCFIMY